MGDLVSALEASGLAVWVRESPSICLHDRTVDARDGARHRCRRRLGRRIAPASRRAMLFVLIAGINVLVLYVTGIARELRTAENAASLPARRHRGLLGALVRRDLLGRLITYNDTLRYALGL
jgi:hypothetical protein